MAEKTILLLGDVMLDKYIYGRAERLSPEAPVPVLMAERTENRLGGAGTVLRNLAGLGVHTVFSSVIGKDGSGYEVLDLLGKVKSCVPYVFTENRLTTTKTRHMAGHHQIARIDRETAADISQESVAHILAALSSEIAHCDAVILSDYGKGINSHGLFKEVLRLTDKPVIVDSKSKNLASFAGATVFTPNLPELSYAAGIPIAGHEMIVDTAKGLMAKYEIKNLLTTCGRDGMVLVESSGAVTAFPAVAKEVFDVTGAGDTVVAVLALSLAEGMSLPDAARRANFAAGIVVGKLGSAVVAKEELAAWS